MTVSIWRWPCNSHFDVAQASRLQVHGASPPRSASNGETPSELAAETAALRCQHENCWALALHLDDEDHEDQMAFLQCFNQVSEGPGMQP